jgi:hypothetical protein
MQTVLRFLAILVIIPALVPIAQAGVATAQSDLVNTGVELVIIDGSTRLRAVDLYTPPGYVPVTWQSPENGFTNVATGDFDGDGSSEVIGLRGGEAVIYDPQQLPGEPNTQGTLRPTPGQVWQHVATGDFNGDGADEVLLVEPSGSGAWMYAYRYTSTGWSRIFSSGPQGSPWQALATGDVMGNARDQVVGLRNFGSSYQMLIFDPANNWQLIHAGAGYGFPWVTVAVGNVSNDSANKDEIVVTRRDAGVSFASFFVFRWVAGTSDLQVVADRVFNPWFQRIALGDVNASGDDEVYLLRNNQAGYQAALASLNLGNDPAINFDSLSGETKWNGVQAGDVDGDGKAEVIVMSSNEYRVFTDPDINTAWQSYSGSFSPTGNFAVGNLDGPGVAVIPALSVTPLTINRTLQAGQIVTDPITIANTGGGTLNWTATVIDGSSWLSISPASGTAPSTPQLRINTSGLAPAPYVGRVRIDAPGANGSPQTVTVNLTVTAPPNPILTVSPLTVDLTLQAGQNASEPITIGNSGAGMLDWTATVVDGSSWLSLSPASGTAPSTPQLQVNTSGLAPDQYVGRVRIDAPGADGSPQTITVNLTVTAPQFSVQPGSVSWFYQPPANPGMRSVSISGQNVAWHAGVVPTSAATRVEEAIAAGQPIKLQDGRLVIGAGANAEEVPIVDWIDVNPVTGVATPGGIFVDLSLVLDRVPYGFNTAAVVFVADTVASPPAVVVRASTLRSLPNGEDLLFLPLIMRGS